MDLEGTFLFKNSLLGAFRNRMYARQIFIERKTKQNRVKDLKKLSFCPNKILIEYIDFSSVFVSKQAFTFQKHTNLQQNLQCTLLI